MSLFYNILIIIFYILSLLCFILLLIRIVFFLFNNRKYYKIKELLINNNNKKRLEDKPDLLNKPLKEFYINSSHNSYISSIQNGSIIFKNTVSNVLKLGARCIEIDIHNVKGNPVVAHGNKNMLTSTYLQLETILDEIVNDGFKTSDPLILYLEIVNNDSIVMFKIGNLLNEKFRDKRLNNRYRMNYTGKDKLNVINAPIKDLLNKIIIVNSTPFNEGLEYILDDSSKFINNCNKDALIYNNDCIKRVYMNGSFLSMMSNNFDPIPFWEKRTNMVVLNFNSYELFLYRNFIMFKDCNFVHFLEY